MFISAKKDASVLQKHDGDKKFSIKSAGFSKNVTILFESGLYLWYNEGEVLKFQKNFAQNYPYGH